MTKTISEFDPKQAPAIGNLLNLEYNNTHEFIPFDENRVLSHIRKHHLKTLVMKENGNLLGLVATHPEEHSEESIHWLAAEETKDHTNIENLLIEHIEKNTTAHAVSTMIDEGDPRIKEWINRGYTLNPGFQRMSAKLDNFKPIPKVDEGIILRSLDLNEEEKLVTVMNAGFGWERLEKGAIQTWRTEEPPFNEEWVQIAEFNNRFVSAVVARPDIDYATHFGLKRGYLGPAATLPDFRNKHLASALTARAMNFLYSREMESVRLGTSEQNVSSIALLTSLGFKVENVRKILRKRLQNTTTQS
jgi:ribosomal protein S18 acetylase RimI-like enzyme